MNLAAIRVALADKVRGYVARTIEIHAYPGLISGPRVEVIPGSPYVNHYDGPNGNLTFGSNGISEVNLIVRIVVAPAAGTPESAQIVLDDLFSIGTGAASSLFDAVMEDPRTLGGLIEDMVATIGDVDLADPDGVTGTMPVRIHARKGGAEL